MAHPGRAGDLLGSHRGYRKIISTASRSCTCKYGDNVCFRTNLEHILKHHSDNHHPAPKPAHLRKAGEENVRIGFHQTSHDAATSIATGYEGFRCGPEGMFGAGIYFATSIDETQRKAHQNGVILACKVDVGRVYRVHAAAPHITLPQLNSMGFDSLEAVPNPPSFLKTGTEFVVFEEWRVLEYCLTSSTSSERDESKLIAKMLGKMITTKPLEVVEAERRRRDAGNATPAG